MDSEYLSYMYDIVYDNDLPAPTHAGEWDFRVTDSLILGSSENNDAIGVDEIPEMYERAAKNQITDIVATTRETLCEFAVDTIRRAREAECIGDIVIAMQKQDVDLVAMIKKAAVQLIGDSRFMSFPYDADPHDSLETSRIIYVGISNSGVPDMYANYTHMRNINTYSVDYFGFTFEAPDNMIDVIVPLNEKHPSMFRSMGTSMMWLFGPTSDAVRAGATLSLVNVGYNHSMLRTVAMSKK